MEELQSALGNHGLTISNLPEKGRCILATKGFNPGEVIIRVDPYVCVPGNSVTEHFCDACFESTNLKKYSGCQKAEWKLHRLECEAFSKLPIQFLSQITPPIRLNIRLHFRSKLESQKIIAASAMDNYNLVKALVAHMSKIDEEKRRMYVDLVNRVNLILPDINRKDVIKNFSKHSTTKQFMPGDLSMWVEDSTCDFIHEPQVLISYIDTAGSTVTRQKELKERYLFTCTCPCCSKVGQYDDIHESAVLEGYRCTDNECDGLLLCNSDDNGFICQQCGRLKSKEEISEMESEIKSLQEKALKAEQSACSHIDFILRKENSLHISI